MALEKVGTILAKMLIANADMQMCNADMHKTNADMQKCNADMRDTVPDNPISTKIVVY